MPVCRRSPAGVHRAEGRSRTDQGQAGGVPPRGLALELNPGKTLITHARTRAARFLGYQITVQHCDTKLTKGRRSVNGRVALQVPLDVITAKCAPYRRQGKPWHRSRLQNLDDYDIVRIYGAEYRGIVNYYLLAHDVWRLTRCAGTPRHRC